MKKLLTILLLCFLLFSCKQECKKKIQTKPLYEKGDIVYIKPDSVRAIIIYVNSEYNKSSVNYTYDVEFYLMS